MVELREIATVLKIWAIESTTSPTERIPLSGGGLEFIFKEGPLLKFSNYL